MPMKTAGPVLISEDEIRRRVIELGTRISEDYKESALVAVGILKGSFVFMADLMRRIDPSIPVDIEFMMVSSYGSGTASSGKLQILQDIESSVQGKDVLLVEDIIDTGLTIGGVCDLLASRGAKSVRVAAMLVKETSRRHPLPLDYVGFRIPDRFVVGYGLDFDQQYRNLKEIHVLDDQ